MINEADLTSFEYYIDPRDSVSDPRTYDLFTPLGMTKYFASSFGQQINLPYAKGSDFDNLRQDLLREEFYEVLDAEEPVHLLKELADLVYVTYGYAATFGWDLDEALRRVHASNMSKLGPDGEPIRREDGKVLKSENYKEPDLSDLV